MAPGGVTAVDPRIFASVLDSQPAVHLIEEMAAEPRLLARVVHAPVVPEFSRRYKSGPVTK